MKLKPHNPDNLKPAQVGRKPWRLLDEDEIIEGPLIRNIQGWAKFDKKWMPELCGCLITATYKTQMSRAALRKARGLK